MKKKELRKRTFAKHMLYDWYNWWINYTPEPTKKTMKGVKDQIMSLFKNEDYSKPNCVKTVYGSEKKPNKNTKPNWKRKHN